MALSLLLCMEWQNEAPGGKEREQAVYTLKGCAWGHETLIVHIIVSGTHMKTVGVGVGLRWISDSGMSCRVKVVHVGQFLSLCPIHFWNLNFPSGK